ncbi:class I SAM-dependent methyltransferase [Candidatus Izemoplasma sp. B36]|uniref:class I SAM-dependent methyltransferase n=1 Tax=Candidatus Izemoplasma sp. B36 TaxID=3242468 RepID=UPI003558D698
MKNLKEANEKLINFWDEWFKKVEPQKINPDDAKIGNELDQYLKELGDVSEKILDLGTGTGYGLLMAKLLGKKVKYGLGIDPAKNAINYIEKTCELSGIKDVEFRVGNHKNLNDFSDGYFDGIICSNVLDVVPEETSNDMIKEISRLLKPNGLFVLKINFYLTDELIKKINMEEVAKNTYTINGIVRGLNFTVDEWVKRLKEFELVKTGEFERIKNGPKDRVLMLKKI